MTQVAINGLGRIGRLVLRQLIQEPRVKVVAVNDLADAATLAHLLTYDSTHGKAAFEVASEGKNLLIGGRAIPVYSEPDPSRLPFGALGARLVLECTGRLEERHQAERHLREGVRRVLLSSPGDDADRTVVMGVNEGAFDPLRDTVVSSGSCTTNCLAPLAKVLDEAFGIERAFMTTVHSYTNDQRILDLPHEDLRRARAATLSMIPTDTGAARAIGRVLPHLEGRLDGLAVRVPTPDVSIVDLTAMLASDASLQALHAAYQAAAGTGPLAPYLEILEAELVSADLVGRTASCIYDPYLTKVLAPRLVKVFAWYDNEVAHAARMKDLCLLLSEGLA